MCGIAGFITSCGASDGELAARAIRMSAPVSHRGPDSFGSWSDADLAVALAHRRLAILDLSQAGHQPMASPTGRYIIVFNGEIYNHPDIRKELESSCQAPDWKGHSDTETLAAGFDAWGIAATIDRTVGMFAVAVWDRAERILTLARDRIGEKPLYYGWNKGVFLFASELKALRAYPGFDADINRNAITLLMRHNYIPAPYCILKGIFKLLPGTILTLPQAAHKQCPWETDQPPLHLFRGKGVSIRTYWSLREVAERGQSHPFAGTKNDAAHELERLLNQAVQSQMISDVPLGAFLSGGVDSSTIVALMQFRSSRPVKTFTIGFNEAGYNETQYAGEVARHLGTEHTELYINPDDARNVIPLMGSIYDEPFSDSSQIPTFLITRMAKRHVSVALSGDAGDELFGGYSRYFQARSLVDKLTKLPLPLRHLLSSGMTTIPVEGWDKLLKLLLRRSHSGLPGQLNGDRIHKLAEIVPARDAADFYLGMISHWRSPADVVRGAAEPRSTLRELLATADISGFEHLMMLADGISYLPDDILVKVDRAAMAVSLETRVPFLDHRVVEFAWQLPLALKMRGNTGKWLLRQVLYKHVPASMIERPKTGFAIPLDSWLRGPLRDWVEALLDEKRLKQEGIFDVRAVRQKWSEHLSGQRNWHFYLWDILMFQAWQEAGN